jgi:hypothetical protein
MTNRLPRTGLLNTLREMGDRIEEERGRGDAGASRLGVAAIAGVATWRIEIARA